MRVLVSGAGFSVAWGHPVTKVIPDRLREIVRSMPPSALNRPSLEDLEQTLSGMENWLSPDAPAKLREFVRSKVREIKEHGLTDSDIPPNVLENVVHFLDAYEKSPKAATWDYEDLLSFFKSNVDGDIAEVASTLGIDRDAFYFPDPEWYFETLLYGLGAVLNWTGPASRSDAATGVKIPPRYRELEARFGSIDGVITLNYDMIPEYALARGRPIDYGFTQARTVRQFIEESETGVTGQSIHRASAKKSSRPPGGFPIYKIHGSLNAAYCPKCGSVLIFPHGNFDGRRPLVEHAWLGTLGYHCAVHCAEPNLRSPPSTPDKLRPLMVPPLADKHGLPELDLLEEVKDAAIQLISRADEILVIGTKVRPSDEVLHEVLRAGRGKKFVFFGTDLDAKGRLEKLVEGPVETGWERL